MLADRLEDYLVHHSMVDKSLQKGFIRGVNGYMEYVFAVQSIISNAQEHSLPFVMSFVDLWNAFGSISHSYINDIIHFVELPPPPPRVYKLREQSVLLTFCSDLHQGLDHRIIPHPKGCLSG